jgi:hypothetical protein
MGYTPINPSSPLALKALFLLALPREAHDSSEFNNLLEGLGRKCPIELQSVSKTTPKPFGYLTRGSKKRPGGQQNFDINP